MGVEYGSMEQVAMEMLDRVGGNSALLPSTLHTRGAVVVASGYMKGVAESQKRTEAMDPFRASVALYGVASAVMSPDRKDPRKRASIEFMNEYFSRISVPSNVFSDGSEAGQLTRYCAGLIADSHTVAPFLNGLLGLEGEGRPSNLAAFLGRLGVVENTVRPTAALSLLEKTNVEATLAAAAHSVDILRRGHDLDGPHVADQATKHIEAYHGPVTQLMGLDSFYTEMRAASLKHALTAKDRIGDIGQAKNMLEGIDSNTVQAVHSTLFDGLGFDSIQQAAGDNVVGYNGMFTANSDSGLIVKSRVKSVESLANKIDGGSGEGIMDVLATTLIAEDEEGVKHLIKTVINNIADKDGDDRFIPSASSGKDHAFSTQGPEDYIIDIREQITGESYELSEKISDGGFKIVKVTGNYRQGDKMIPVEIMFTTGKDYDDSRFGRTAHFLMKNGVVLPDHLVDKAVRSMGGVNKRAKNFGCLDLNCHPAARDRYSRFMSVLNT